MSAASSCNGFSPFCFFKLISYPSSPLLVKLSCFSALLLWKYQDFQNLWTSQTVPFYPCAFFSCSSICLDCYIHAPLLPSSYSLPPMSLKSTRVVTSFRSYSTPAHPLSAPIQLIPSSSTPLRVMLFTWSTGTCRHVMLPMWSMGTCRHVMLPMWSTGTCRHVMLSVWSMRMCRHVMLSVWSMGTCRHVMLSVWSMGTCRQVSSEAWPCIFQFYICLNGWCQLTLNYPNVGGMNEQVPIITSVQWLQPKGNWNDTPIHTPSLKDFKYTSFRVPQMSIEPNLKHLPRKGSR